MSLSRPAARRSCGTAPAFWRRSVQARVVRQHRAALRARWSASSAGSSSSRPATGCWRTASTPVVQEAEGETEAARAAAGRDARASTSTSPAQQQALVEPIQARGAHARGFAVILSPPIGEGVRLADGGAKFTEGLDLASVPESLEARFDSLSADGVDLHRHPAPPATIPGLPEGPGIVVGSQVRLPADDNTYTLYYLYPLAEQQETLALVSRAMLIAGRPAAAAGRLPDLAGDPAGGHPDPDGAPGRRAARRRPAAGAAAGDAARTTWRAWRRRSTRWRPTCSARSASSRS